jgi:hypothetical protein
VGRIGFQVGICPNFPNGDEAMTKSAPKFAAALCTLFLSFLTIAGFVAIVPAAANAAATTKTTTKPLTHVTTAKPKFSKVSLQDTQVVQINATAHGALEVEAQQPKLEAQVKAEVQSGTKLDCRNGEAIYGASTTSSGKTVWTVKPGNHGMVHACLIDGIWRQILGKHQWNCGNQIVWMHQPLPKHAVVYKGRYVIVTHFTFSANVTVKAIVAATLSAKVSCKTTDSSASSGFTVSGYGFVYLHFHVSGNTKAQALASVSGSHVKLSSSQQSTLRGNAKASAKLKLSGRVSDYCTSTPVVPTPPAVCTNSTATNYGQPLPCVYPTPTPVPAPVAVCTNSTATNYGQPLPCVFSSPPPTPTPTPTPTPVSHYTQISCNGFEEISGGGSFIVSCDVADDNGAPISLNVSNSSYYTVSGINCYSQNGASSCTGDGTFQFRVDGVNNTDNTQQASMTVTASANGIPATYEADFNVDPEAGGF